MAKTNTSKNKKPATAVRRKPTQLDRIEETAGTFHHTVTTALRNFDKRITEQGKVLDSICASLRLDHGDRLKAHTDMLHKIQSDLSLLKSGASFMQELDRVAKEEQPVPREEPKEEWKVGDWYWNARRDWKEPQRVDAVEGEKVFTEFEGDLYGYFKSNIVKATPAEISEHESKIKAKEEEQKLARLTFGTRVHAKEKEGDIEREYYVLGPTGPIKGGLYHLWHEGMECVHTIYIDRITIID